MGAGSRLSWLAPTSLLLLLAHTPTCFLLPYWGSELSAGGGGSDKGYGTSVCVLTTKVFTVVQDGRPGHLMSLQRADALLTPANKVGERPPPSQEEDIQGTWLTPATVSLTFLFSSTRGRSRKTGTGGLCELRQATRIAVGRGRTGNRDFPHKEIQTPHNQISSEPHRGPVRTTQMLRFTKPGGG